MEMIVQTLASDDILLLMIYDPTRTRKCWNKVGYHNLCNSLFFASPRPKKHL